MRKFNLLIIFLLLTSALFSKNYNKMFLNALKNENISKLEEALIKGADVNIKNEYGMPAIVIAAAFGNYEIAKLFIEYEADLNAKNKDGGTALHYAAGYNFTDIVKILIKNGADINAKDNLRNTPLFLASITGHSETVKILTENKANLNVRNIKEFTPLMISSQEGHLNVVKILVSAGARISDERPMGGAALGFAADRGHVEIVKFLYENGADINLQDQYGGNTPLIGAAYMGKEEVVKYLIKIGVDINIKNKKGQTALDIAKQQGHKKIIKILKEKDELDQSEHEGSDDKKDEVSENDMNFLVNTTIKLTQLIYAYYLNNYKYPSDLEKLTDYYDKNKKMLHRKIKKIGKDPFKPIDTEKIKNSYKKIEFIRNSDGSLTIDFEIISVDEKDKTHNLSIELNFE